MANNYTGYTSEFGLLLYSNKKYNRKNIFKRLRCKHDVITKDRWVEAGFYPTDYNVYYCEKCGKIKNIKKWSGEKRKLKFGRIREI